MSIVVIWKGFAFWPSMTRVASEMKLQFMVLEMKGKEREALRGAKASRNRRGALSRPRRRRLNKTPSQRRFQYDHVTLKFLLTDSPQVALDDLDVVIPSHKLNVHGSTDVEGLGDLRRRALDLLLGLDVEFLRG